MTEKLASKHCVPCRGDMAPLSVEEVSRLLPRLDNSWEVDSPNLPKQISRTGKFPDFAKAFDFASRVAAIAEQESHHPDLLIGWGKVGVTLTTHSIKGLSENDFVLAAKIDELG